MTTISLFWVNIWRVSTCYTNATTVPLTLCENNMTFQKAHSVTFRDVWFRGGKMHRYQQWKLRLATMSSLWSLMAPKVFLTTTSGAATKPVINTALCFRWHNPRYWHISAYHPYIFPSWTSFWFAIITCSSMTMLHKIQPLLGTTDTPLHRIPSRRPDHTHLTHWSLEKLAATWRIYLQIPYQWIWRIFPYYIKILLTIGQHWFK